MIGLWKENFKGTPEGSIRKIIKEHLGVLRRVKQMVRLSNSDELTEQEEMYAQARAKGHTKTDAAKIAYPDGKYSRQIGYDTEKRERVIARIAELKAERAEASGLDLEEQLRRYNEIYLQCMREGKVAMAMKALERIDSLGGFDAPTRSVSLKGDLNKLPDALKGDDLQKDIARFSKVLSKHTDMNIIEGKLIEYSSEDLGDQ